MKLKFIFSFSFLLLFCFTELNSQDRKELENQRLKIIEKIEETAQLLNDNKASKSNTISDYNLLESQIKFREDLIANIGFEISQAELLINQGQSHLDSLTGEMESLRNRQVKLLRALYVRKQAQNPLGSFLSVKSINEAFRRWSYTKQFETRNQRQAKIIKQLHDRASGELDQLQFYKTQREKLRGIEEEHRSILQDELDAKNGIIRDLSNNEKNLIRKLGVHQKNREAFNQAIETLIIAELASGQKSEYHIEEPELEKEIEDAPKSKKRGASFRSNRGYLPWPVEKGVIVQKYGKQKHPTIRNLEISNNGIDIASSKGATVKSIFKGTVIGTSFIPGYDNMVMIQHGNYYTVYSKLKEVFVEKGAAVSASQAIGRLGDDIKDGNIELHFELWRGKTKQNPEKWLIKK